MSIKTNLDPLETADSFTYLVHTSAYKNSVWEALHQKLGMARRRWGMALRVTEKTGITVRDGEILYKAVAQTVLLYRS